MCVYKAVIREEKFSIFCTKRTQDTRLFLEVFFRGGSWKVIRWDKLFFIFFLMIFYFALNEFCVSFGIKFPFSSVHVGLATCTTACTFLMVQLCCNDMQFFLWGKFSSPLYFLMRWNKKITKYFDKESTTFRQSLFPACLLCVLDCYCFFIASACNLTITKMVWNFWHVWRKYSCREALAWKAGEVQNKNSRLQKADFINQRFRRWTLLGYWSKKKSWRNLAAP